MQQMVQSAIICAEIIVVHSVKQHVKSSLQVHVADSIFSISQMHFIGTYLFRSVQLNQLRF